MKHLKSFENIQPKKYILIGYSLRMVIIEILFVESGQFSGEKKYIYYYRDNTAFNIKSNEMKKTEGYITGDYRNIADDIIFTSDNIEECKDKLLLIANQRRYNI